MRFGWCTDTCVSVISHLGVVLKLSQFSNVIVIWSLLGLVTCLSHSLCQLWVSSLEWDINPIQKLSHTHTHQELKGVTLQQGNTLIRPQRLTRSPVHGRDWKSTFFLVYKLYLNQVTNHKSSELSLYERQSDGDPVEMSGLKKTFSCGNC